MKKLVKLFSLTLLLTLISSCGGGNLPSSSIDPSSQPDGKTVIDFYSINDFHGATEDNGKGEVGISKIANFLKTKKAYNPYSVILSAGDMWQGSADSNITQGKLVSDCMENIGFDAMELGNHEFDWTSSVIEENAKRVTFPFLGANIVDKDTQEIAPFCKPYTVVERNNIKIGIIGVMGPYETSILKSSLGNYEFSDVDKAIAKYGEILTDQEDVDFTIVLSHDSWATLSAQQTRALNTGYVDAIFGGHTHTDESKVFTVDGKKIPYVQGGDNGEYISQITITFDNSTLDYEVTNCKTITLANQSLTADSEVQKIYQKYLDDEINKVKNVVVGYIDNDIRTGSGALFACYAMYMSLNETTDSDGDLYDVDAAFHNVSRTTLEKGKVTYGNVYKAYPFDNEIYIFNVPGSSLIQYLGSGSYSNYSRYTINQVDTTKTYSIAVIDYLAINDRGYFKSSEVETATHTMLYARDCICDVLKDSTSTNPFKTSSFAS